MSVFSKQPPCSTLCFLKLRWGSIESECNFCFNYNDRKRLGRHYITAAGVTAVKGRFLGGRRGFIFVAWASEATCCDVMWCWRHILMWCDVNVVLWCDVKVVMWCWCRVVFWCDVNVVLWCDVNVVLWRDIGVLLCCDIKLWCDVMWTLCCDVISTQICELLINTGDGRNGKYCHPDMLQNRNHHHTLCENRFNVSSSHF